MSNPIIANLRQWQTFRRYHMRAHNGIKLRLAALARRMLGWQPDLAEESRSKFREMALELVEGALAGKPADGEVAEALWPFVVMDLESFQAHVANREEFEKNMAAAVHDLPIRAWASTVRGLGDLGLATILGEAGDPFDYATASKWIKRLGWAPAEEYPMGEKKKGRKIPRSTKGAVYGDVAMPLFFAQSQLVDKTTGEIKREAGPYRKVYDARRAHTAETHPDWKKGHSHADAMRVMLKQLLIDVWAEWRKAESMMVAAE